MLNNNAITAEILSSAKRIALRAGLTEDQADDMVQDAVVAVLSSDFDPSKGSLKSYLGKSVANLARNFRRNTARHNPAGDRLTAGSCSVNATDFQVSEGAIRQTGAEGAILAGGDARETLERRSDLAALEALEADERAFCEALAMGHTATEAAALVGWSNAKATRKRRDIAARLKAM